MRTALLLLGLLLLVLALLFLLGPRLHQSVTLRNHELPNDLDAYLRAQEEPYDDLRPELKKEIIWADSTQKNRTPYSVVYIHGFGASRWETAPLADTVAARLGANLFYTRLKGHGRSADAMAEGTIDDWSNDVYEAYRIGQRIGERVLLLGVSMGGALSTWLVAQPEVPQPHALILMSPCYGLANADDQQTLERLVGLPWAPQLLTAAVGPYRGDATLDNPAQSAWTDPQSTKALLPLVQSIQLSRAVDVSQITCPTYIIYSPNDSVVNPALIEARYPQFGSSQKDSLRLLEVGDPQNHVLAGDAVSPDETLPIADAIVSWLQGL